MSKPLKKSFIELPAAGESLENALQSSQLKGSNGAQAKYGRLEALNMVRTIDQFDSRSVNAAASKTDENVKKDGQNIGAMLSKINNVNNPTTPLSAITASTTIPQPLQPLKALKGIDKPLSKPGSPRKELLVDSPISDFREVQRDFQHPALLLNILPDQKDREVFTEYDKICNEVLAALSEIEMAIEEMTLWKDDFLKQSAPSNVKLQMTLMFARVFRSKSDLHEPLFELIKQVKMYSRPWSEKKFAILELEQDFHRQQNVIDVAIKKLETLQQQIQRLKSEKRVGMWENVTKRLINKVIQSQKRPTSTPNGDPLDIAQLIRGRGISQVTFAETPSTKSEVSTPASRRVGTGDGQATKSSLKDSLRDYISSDDPSWKKSAKDVVRKFTRILNRHHPALVDRLKQAEKPTKLTRSSWSLINLTKFTKEAEKYSIDQMDDLEQEPNPLARSNSFNTRLELVGARQRRPFKESAQRQSNNATAAAVAEAPARHSRKSSDNPFHNANSETESTCSEYEEVDETDEFQYQDYLTENDQATLKETIKNFFDSKVDNSTEEDGTGVAIPAGPPGSNEESGAKMNKTKFNLQDVMELTLLHAQQMQLLSSEYEKTLSEMTSKIQAMESENTVLLSDYEQRLKIAQERAQRLAKEYMGRKKEDQDGSAARLDDNLHGHGSGDGLNVDEHRDEHNAVKKIRKLKHIKGRRHHKSKKHKDRHPARIAQRRLMPRKKPVFSTEPFRMNFLQRLKWFTAVKLHNQAALQEKFTAQEMQSNERKLVQTGLIIDPNQADGGKSSHEFAAEFMPPPGRVHTPKHRNIFSEHGLTPWGGKFKLKQRSSVNILNLFEVMSLMEKNNNTTPK